MLKIKPVSKGYFTRSKVSLRDIAQKRRSGIAIYATRENPDGTQTGVFLIPEPAKNLTVGKFYPAEHMNTGRKYGEHLVQGVFNFKYRSGVLEVKGFDVGTRSYSEIFELEAVAFELA